MGIPGGLRAKSREQDKIGAWRGMLPCYICPGFAARPSSSLPVLIIPQPGTKSLPMANTGSARWRLGKVRSQLSKFLELRRACCWLQKVEACGMDAATISRILPLTVHFGGPSFQKAKPTQKYKAVDG